MTIKNRLFNFIPANNQTLYHFCRRYVDRYDGVNDSDMTTNGETKLLTAVIPACQVVFDVGANVGHWTQAVLALNPQATIHAFEPSTAVYQQLMAQNLPHNVRARPLGLSSAPGEQILYVFPQHSGLNSLYARAHAPQETSAAQPQERIQLTTLDDYCQKEQVTAIDFLKIDVEGHDLAVLQGARKMLENGRIHLIQFEYGGTHIDARIFLKDFFALLQPYGYALHKIHPHGLKKYDRYQPALDTFQYQNWLAVRQPQDPNLIEKVTLC
ncbi:MAG: FkbM family methyltransferase [Chloroflexi bacterium]|jgi:FkbM family methyltransferase|nr:FkbM family methyltransferase [Chloroflexota bacterium]MBK6713462.1 FkbM family methyltransferase [Chloroflexota bacterium]MBK7180676.1 FkbM family methyltransferase [Chloroflexota bacterium]MBP6804483.1 FkbM family methyltransferase [Chloroflexota bacterium]MBP7590235.1 FkbM family methyltransferase [Chloroflexota bacterium]